MGVGKGGGISNADPDELGGTFAVADDELRELLRECCDNLCESLAIFGHQRCDWVATCGAVGEESQGVVCGGIPVYADGVERAVNGVCEEGLEGFGRNGRVGEEHAKKGGHVGVNHAGAFGHAC